MARYKDGKFIDDFQPYFHPIYPNWIAKDCGCCGGLIWGGEELIDCDSCSGGTIYIHVPSGLCCHYPGGPIAQGRYTQKEIQVILLTVKITQLELALNA